MDTNESNNTISKESSGHQNNVKSYSEGFVGTWNDLYSQRCQMTIESDVDGIYTILIHWVDSASENNRWEFTGQYDSTQNEIVYHGV